MRCRGRGWWGGVGVGGGKVDDSTFDALHTVFAERGNVSFAGDGEKLGFGVVVGDEPRLCPGADPNEVAVERLSDGWY